MAIRHRPRIRLRPSIEAAGWPPEKVPASGSDSHYRRPPVQAGPI
ncbi:hypothetical protein XA26_25660 [Mycolicibacterium fortuitum]|uniref:Uncharacterized protein n=1 Tax=Mycolicibacterium fortuitum TaxID=1766 RepID=A0A0N9XIL0_MYCFO|nr:hypothetical protein G155_00126 [Mycobacterium sp. VKM Ac-1817D]ALI26409.1 hypothetical protein XA26_25660 [Mycolicibacterium fortuitum]